VKTALTEIDELVDYCDERCKSFVRAWAGKKLPLPVVGFELQDDGRVCAQAELAWPVQQVAAVLPEGVDAHPAFEKQGWKVLDATDLTGKEAKLRELLGV